MRSTSAFTLMEVMITVIMIGVIATLSLPRLTGLLEKARAEKATNNLKSIHAAEKRFKLDDPLGEYFPKSCNNAAADTLQEINAGLGLSTRDSGFTYRIKATGLCSGSPASRRSLNYTITAERTAEGPCAGKVITMTEEGGEPSSDDCSIW
ncbi:MAG: prepilin-type N-terminal cleavage/methylation domain-containing protein [Elusimicrobia bacterium]|nr:prepilin-type N-terminal cleavage/methylation domain-containing protein [Elusimicrobiota bacterium]